MTYIVTGACGYVGYAVVKELLSRGKTVRCLALENENISRLKKLGADIYFGDITKPDTLENIFDVDGELAVIHAAGMVSVETRISSALYAVNVEGTRSVLGMCKKKCAKLVYIGSVDAVPPVNGRICKAYYDPQAVRGAYAKTKAEAALDVIKSVNEGLDACILLPCAVFGPYDFKGGMVSSLVKIYLKKHTFPLISGGYEFADVRDIAFAAVNAVHNGKRGESYILSNRFFELKEIVNRMRDLKGLKRIRITVPNSLAKLAGAVVELFCSVFKKRPLFTAYTITCVNTHVEYSCEAAKRDLAYSPRPFDETLRDTVAFLDEQNFKEQK